MIKDLGYTNRAEKGFLEDSLARTDNDLLMAKYQNMAGSRFGGGDVLSEALANKLQSAYQGQLSDIKARFARENPVQAAQLAQTQNRIISQNYADELRRQAEIKAADEAKKARKKAKQKAVASLAGAVGGAAIGGPSGAMIGGGAGGLLAGGGD